MKAIILAAGEGTHLSPFSETRPISMIGVAGRSMLDNTFGLLKSAGINDIFIVVGHKKDKLIERLQQQDHNADSIHYGPVAEAVQSSYLSYVKYPQVSISCFCMGIP